MATVSIPLSSRKYPGLFAIVDEEDAERALRHKWYPSKRKNGYYAQRAVDGCVLTLHLFVLGAPPEGHEIDHINGDTLDCRKSNLRYATHAQNTRNRRKTINGKNPYKGTHGENNKWRAIIDCDGVRYRSRLFALAEDAAAAYDEMAVALFGDFARTNFQRSMQISLIPACIHPPRPRGIHAVGVYFDKSKNRWKAEIVRNGQTYRLGSFHTEADAAKAYQEKAEELSRLCT